MPWFYITRKKYVLHVKYIYNTDIIFKLKKNVTDTHLARQWRNRHEFRIGRYYCHIFLFFFFLSSLFVILDGLHEKGVIQVLPALNTRRTHQLTRVTELLKRYQHERDDARCHSFVLFCFPLPSSRQKKKKNRWDGDVIDGARVVVCCLLVFVFFLYNLLFFFGFRIFFFMVIWKFTVY